MGRAAIQAGRPRLWLARNGIVGFPRHDGVAAKAGLQVGARLFVVCTSGTTTYLEIYDASGWTRQTVTAGGGQAPRMLFGDSRGHFYFSLEYNGSYAGTGCLWKIPAGSVTPEKVLSSATTPAFTNAADWIQGMCEDDAGHLYASEYSSGVGMFKSQDDGATWTKIVATSYPGSGLTPATHIHGVVWDPYRQVLISSCGDAANMYSQVSGDGGVSWQSWTHTNQTTGFAFDSDYIYLTADLSTDRAIYRAAVNATGVAAVVGVTPEKVLDPVTDLGIASHANMGHSWGGWVVDGLVVFPFGSVSTAGYQAHLVVSGDQGESWHAFKAGTKGAANSDWGHVPSYAVADDYGFHYGIVYGLDFVQWRMYAAGTGPRIDETGGEQWLSDGMTAPWSELPDYGWSAQLGPVLDSDVTVPVTLSLNDVSVARQGFAFTGTTTVAPHVVKSCDAVAGVTSPWAISKHASSAAADEATIKTEGAGSIKLTLSGSAEYAQIQNTTAYSAVIATYPDAWIRGDWRCDTAISAAMAGLCKIYNGNDYADIQLTSAGKWMLRVRNAANGIDNTFTTTAVVAVGAWNSLKLHIKRATNGRVRGWVNGVLLWDIIGVNTSGTNPQTTGHLGVSTSQAATVYVDNIKCSYSDPDEPSGLTLAGSRQTVSSAILSGRSSSPARVAI
jgi:hypothetical protein